MRYILNNEGYIEIISFSNEIECNNKTCTEYTGTVPSGYSSLAEWSKNAVIQAYKIVDGNLTHDPNKEEELEEEWQKIVIDGLVTAGHLTTNKTEVVFNIPLDRAIPDNATIEIKLTRCHIRHADGGYISNGADLSTLGTYTTISKIYGNRILVTLTLDTESTFTNNCPVSIHVVKGYVILK